MEKFVLRVIGTSLLFPAIGGMPPRLFDSREQANRKRQYEFADFVREKWEVVPYDPATMTESAPAS